MGCGGFIDFGIGTFVCHGMGRCVCPACERVRAEGGRPRVALNPTATYIGSFGNRILRNGRRPGNTETRPRIAEKYQILKPESTPAPGCLWWSCEPWCPFCRPPPAPRAPRLAQPLMCKAHCGPLMPLAAQACHHPLENCHPPPAACSACP